MSVFLDGISIRNFRSFGNEHQRIGPLKKINLLIGANNCGKSNVLAFLHGYLSSSMQHRGTSPINSKVLTHLDIHNGQLIEAVEFSIGFSRDRRDNALAQYIDRIDDRWV